MLVVAALPAAAAGWLLRAGAQCRTRDRASAGGRALPAQQAQQTIPLYQSRVRPAALVASCYCSRFGGSAHLPRCVANAFAAHFTQPWSCSRRTASMLAAAQQQAHDARSLTCMAGRLPAASSASTCCFTPQVGAPPAMSAVRRSHRPGGSCGPSSCCRPGLPAAAAAAPAGAASAAAPCPCVAPALPPCMLPWQMPLAAQPGVLLGAPCSKKSSSAWRVGSSMKSSITTARSLQIFLGHCGSYSMGSCAVRATPPC